MGVWYFALVACWFVFGRFGVMKMTKRNLPLAFAFSVFLGEKRLPFKGGVFLVFREKFSSFLGILCC